MKIVPASIEIISTEPYEEMLKRVERAGRVCYKSEGSIEDGSAERFIRNILKRGHESVIEHAGITVKVTCDRGQESTRYCNYSKDKFENQISCIDIANGFSYDLNKEEDRQKYLLWQEAMESAEKYYFKMLELGARAEEARSILPNSLKTEIVMTMDLREWRHFICLRGSKAAHPQIREITRMILKEFQERYPLFFEDLTAE